jgi:hypothetical protein
MAVASKLKEKYLRRLEELIAEAQALPPDSRQRVKSVDFDGHKTYVTDHFLKWAEFVEWRTSVSSVLDVVVPPGSIHRKAVDAFPELSNELHIREYGSSFLKAVRNDFDQGLFENLASEVDAEISAEYLSQAESLLAFSRPEDKGEVAAAVIAGAVLEHGLRSICSMLNPEEPITSGGKTLALNGLIDAVKKRKVFNELTAKELRGWAAIRNAAAHGNFEEFNRSQVESMVQGITYFLVRHG